MKVFIQSLGGGRVLVRARAEGQDVVGDMSLTLNPGEDFLGWPAAELRALGDGEHEIEPRDNGGLMAGVE